MSVCQSCGACCAYFRVSFPWIETSLLNENPVPVEFTKIVTNEIICMSGTETKPAKCIVLIGEVGKNVDCSIYENRSSTCKELQPGEEKCNEARLAHGLSKIEKEMLLSI